MKKRWILAAILASSTSLFADQEIDVDYDLSPEEQFGAVETGNQGPDDVAEGKKNEMKTDCIECQGDQSE